MAKRSAKAKDNSTAANAEVGGNIGGSLLIGNNNTINMSSEQIKLSSLHQLPPPPADFTGRETIIAELLKDFDSHKGATISGLTGMGGIGKTVLGLVVAHQLVEKYPDGQIFLDLKGTTTPLSVVDIARYVILQFEPNSDLRALNESNLSGIYQSVLHEKKALLFLDNALDASQIVPLIPPASCALLVTSRKTFSVAGLRPHRVGALDEKESVDFLLELCPRVGNHAGELAKICAYLPLALRIAGSFLKVNPNWKMDKYLAELKSARGRFETFAKSRAGAELTTEPDLLATLELSYKQLQDEEQRKWRALGVFPDSFAGNAVSAMWGVDEREAENLLALFIRYSLMDYNETAARYELHDLLVEYARGQMGSGEEQEARMWHAAYYLAVLEGTNSLYEQGNEGIMQGLRLFDLEWNHIQAAYIWLTENRATNRQINEMVMQYPAASPQCLALRLHPKESVSWLQTALAASQILENKVYEGTYLNNLGFAYLAQGDYKAALSYLKQALSICQQIGDKAGEGTTLNNISQIFKAQGNYETALTYLQQSLAICQQIGDKAGEGTTLNNISQIFQARGDYKAALSYLKQALSIRQQIGDKAGEGTTLNNVSQIFLVQGDHETAFSYLKQALSIRQQIGDKAGEGTTLNNISQIFQARRTTRLPSAT